MTRKSLASNKQRGAVLLSVLVIAIILAAITGACALAMSSYSTLSTNKSSAITATELAEAGVNSELNYIAIQARAGSSTWYHANTTQSGQPLPGNPGSTPSTGWSGPSGSYWVYTTPVNAATPGAGFTITCEAVVGGQIKTSGSTTSIVGGARRTVSIVGTADGLFNLYTTYATSSDSSHSCVHVHKGGSVTVHGCAGTNGSCHFEGDESHDSALNGNCFRSDCSGHQYSGNCQKNPYQNSFPSTKQVCDKTFSGCTNGSEWSYLSSHNNNNCIRIYKANLASGTAISASSTMVGNFSCSHTTLCNYDNSYWSWGQWSWGNWTGGDGDDDNWGWGNWTSGDGDGDDWGWGWGSSCSDNHSCAGDWAYASNNKGCNHIPGSSTETAIILPPGDYYFSNVDCSQFSSCEHFIIDNADLSEGGVNAGKPVRIWIGQDNSSTNDCINIPFEFTDCSSNGTKTFRIFYGKDGCSLSILNSCSSAKTLCGSIYAVSQESSGCSVNICGGDSSCTQNIQGSIVGDYLNYQGSCSVTAVAGNCTKYDYSAGTGYLTTSTYSVTGGQ